MFVGHLAVSLTAKVAEPRASLGTLLAASFGLDLLWPFLLFAGVETVSVAPGNTAFTPLAFESYPWSHSLLMAVVWGGLAATVMYGLGRGGRVALIVGTVVLSHWILDFITHRPDLPLWPGGPKFGLGLWNSIPATILVEGAVFLAAIGFYVRASKPRDRAGTWSLWALVALTGLIWVSQPWSPPPPGANSVAAVVLAMLLFPFWGAWIDRHRSMNGET